MISLEEFSKKYYPQDGCTLITAEVIDKYNEYFRDNAKVGDGATLCLWSDRQAFTIIKRTSNSLTLRRCKAIRDPKFVPKWEIGGFSAICTNQDEQRYTYEEDENGRVIKVYWSDKCKRFRFLRDGIIRPNRHEYRDFNF